MADRAFTLRKGRQASWFNTRTPLPVTEWLALIQEPVNVEVNEDCAFVNVSNVHCVARTWHVTSPAGWATPGVMNASKGTLTPSDLHVHRITIFIHLLIHLVDSSRTCTATGKEVGEEGGYASR
jgi:hypothetical protein